MHCERAACIRRTSLRPGLRISPFPFVELNDEAVAAHVKAHFAPPKAAKSRC
jgi:hypothetical protein